MATKLAAASAPSVHTPHTSGLFADMTLDGPEIGTLVLIVDRAKNLPNRKTMGKQNPYCAARLGKEAKKTETDRRGGQTPRWDQELRFIVHDSPDYNRMKISVFSEDKRTDLVGEAWIELTDVVVPGGGKKDLWQELNCKGKYAGELRIELTYYDERPRPAEPIVSPLPQQMAGSEPRVKRRPLHSGSNGGHLTPDTIPQPLLPGRAKHGPRDLRTPPRANSLPPDTVYHESRDVPERANSNGFHAEPPALAAFQHPYEHLYEQHSRSLDLSRSDENGLYMQSHSQPDFLPQLPPSNRQRNSLPSQSATETRQLPPHRPHLQPLPSSPLALEHSVSAPIVPSAYRQPDEYDEGYQLHTDYTDPIPDVEYQYQQLEERSSHPNSHLPWQMGPVDSRAGPQYAEEHDSRPPPPPLHSNSSPAIPQRSPAAYSSPLPPYAAATPNARSHSIPDSSPLQTLERKYATPPRSPIQNPHTSAPQSPLSQQRPYDGSPSARSPGQVTSPFVRQQGAPRMGPGQPGIIDQYNTTPSRPHPLSREMRSHSPHPYSPQDQFESDTFASRTPEYRSREGTPLARPRPVSPHVSVASSQPSSLPRARTAYDIQFPIRSAESSEDSPLSTSQRGRPSVPTADYSTPIRKSVSPRPTPSASAGGGMPYSPDDFNIHNPHAQESMLPNGNSPHSPYQIRPGSEVTPRDTPSGPIVDWHGKEIDPSDRLPVHSWAPEPEKKTSPARTYGLGRDRDFGPRQNAAGSGGKSLSKDTVVNVRMRSQPETPLEQGFSDRSTFRNRLQKKLTPTKSPVLQSQQQPLQERQNYNSVSSPNLHDEQQFYAGSHQQRGYRGSYAEMSEDALSREISSIDIGGGSRHTRAGSVPAPTAFVPVRSHKDRRSFY